MVERERRGRLANAGCVRIDVCWQGRMHSNNRSLALALGGDRTVWIGWL
ncbi:hypothetical protein XHC_2956 [Xanthomonas hortorum pv. carotae str. M081]|nr:hypothetical protein XHC_2956 [Xanthomonas hortorum pv. carotae str. M081]